MQVFGRMMAVQMFAVATASSLIAAPPPSELGGRAAPAAVAPPEPKAAAAVTQLRAQLEAVIAARTSPRAPAVQDGPQHAFFSAVESVAVPPRGEGAPPLIEVTYAIAAEEFFANQAQYTAQLVAEIATAARVATSRVVAEYVRAGSLTVGFAIVDPLQAGGGGGSFEITSDVHTNDRGFGCLPAAIVNDFDTSSVVATIAADAGGPGFIAAAPAAKPYFHDVATGDR